MYKPIELTGTPLELCTHPAPVMSVVVKETKIGKSAAKNPSGIKVQRLSKPLVVKQDKGVE